MLATRYAQRPRELRQGRLALLLVLALLAVLLSACFHDSPTGPQAATAQPAAVVVVRAGCPSVWNLRLPGHGDSLVGNFALGGYIGGTEAWLDTTGLAHPDSLDAWEVLPTSHAVRVRIAPPDTITLVCK